MADTPIDISGMPDPDSTGVPAATSAPSTSSAAPVDITGMPTPEQEFQKALGRTPANSVELDNFLATPWAFAGENPALAKGSPTFGQSIKGAAAGIPQAALAAGDTALSMGTGAVAKAGSFVTKAAEYSAPGLSEGEVEPRDLKDINADASAVESALNPPARTEVGAALQKGMADTLLTAWKNAHGPEAKAYADKALRSHVGDAVADHLEFGLGAAGDLTQALPAVGLAAKAVGIAGRIPGAIGRAAEAAAEPSADVVPGSQLSRTAQQAQGKLETAAAQAKPKAAPAPSAAPAAAPAAPEAPKLSAVSPELQEGIASGVHKAGGDVDLDTVRRHIEADTLPVPVRLTEGQATQNPTLISEEQNLRGANPELAQRFNEQNEALKDNLEHIRTQVAPDVATTDPAAHGDTLMGSYKSVDDASVADINAKYQKLKDAAGGDFPVDAGSLLGNVRGALQKELLTDHAPPSIMKVLDQAAADGKMPYETFEALRTNLAAIQRDATQSGLARRAAGVIRDQLEQIPMTGLAADLKPLADAARGASKARFKAIDADPAYKAVVEGTATPDDFVRKYVINGKRDNVALMQKTLAHDPQATQTMSAATVDHLQGKALGQTGNFSQSPYNRALQDLAPKLQHLVPGEQAEQLKSVGNVARHTQSQPRGSSVNNSNTLVGSLAKGVGTMAGEIPVVGKGAAKLLDEKTRAARVRQALEPGAGVARKIERTPGGDEPPPSGGGAPKPSSPGVASATEKPLGATIRGGNERGAVGNLNKQRGFLRSTEPTTNNASGESSASVEAQNRVAQEKANGQHRFQIDPDGNVTPLKGVDSVDARAPEGHLIVQRGVGASHYSILDRGGLPQGQAQGLLARSVGLGKLDNRPLGARLPGQRGAVGVLNRARNESPLAGAPEGDRPNSTARAARDAYKAANGIDAPNVSDYRFVDPDTQKAIANAYDAMKHDPTNPKVKAAYDAFKAETLEQYKQAVKAGIKFKLDPDYPYVKPREVMDDVRNNKRMSVFPTEQGFGAAGGTPDHPLMERSPVNMGGKPATYNDLFRAVHDYYGHVAEGNGFRANGEYNAWRSHRSMYSPAAQPAMDAETLGQNSWVNAGPHAEANAGASQTGTTYAEQKAGIMKLPKAVMQSAQDGVGADEHHVTGLLTEPERAQLRADTTDRLIKAFKSLPPTPEYAAAALAGQAKRGWYRASAEAITNHFGADAPRFTALLAAMSPQTSVQMNFSNALKSFLAWDEAGRPKAPAEIRRIMEENSAKNPKSTSDSNVLDAWVNNSIRALTADDPSTIKLSGPKVHSFYHNLMGHVNEVTNDAWMSTFANIDPTAKGTSLSGGLNQSGPGKTPMYMAMSGRAREAAKMLTKMTGETWTPAEVQETVWSWAKTAFEHAEELGDQTIPELVKHGKITDDLIRSTPDFHQLFATQEHAGLIGRSRFAGNVEQVSGAQGAGANAPADAEKTASAQRALRPHLDKAAERLEGVRQTRNATAGEEAPF